MVSLSSSDKFLAKTVPALDPDSLSLRITGRRLTSVKNVIRRRGRGSTHYQLTFQLGNPVNSYSRDLRALSEPDNVLMGAGNDPGGVPCSHPPQLRLFRRQHAELAPTIRERLLEKSMPSQAEGFLDLAMVVFDHWDDVTDLPVTLNHDEEISTQELIHYSDYCEDVADHAQLFSTSCGLLGMAPEGISAHDEIVLAQGAELPIILRKENEGWTFHGFAYVHGIMDGRLLEFWKHYMPEPEEFVLR